MGEACCLVRCTPACVARTPCFVPNVQLWRACWSLRKGDQDMLPSVCHPVWSDGMRFVSTCSWLVRATIWTLHRSTVHAELPIQLIDPLLCHACLQDSTSMLARMFDTDWAGRNRVDEKVGLLVSSECPCMCHVSTCTLSASCILIRADVEVQCSPWPCHRGACSSTATRATSAWS